MTDAQAALAQVREALADRPSAGPWVATLRDPGTFQVATVDNFGVYSRHPDHGGNAAGFPEHDAAYIAKCNPENIAAILAHVEAQEAEIEQLREMLARMYAGSDLYCDDGELQDARADPFIDFKRDSVADIRCAMVERNERKEQR